MSTTNKKNMRILKTGIKKIIEKTFDVEITRPKVNPVESSLRYVNRAINFEKGIIFIAIPKTGTTTVSFQLRQLGTPMIKTPHLNIVQIRTLLYVYLLKESLETKNSTFPTSNVLSDTAIRKKVANIFDSLFKFSAVRNPWARTVSLYYRREGTQLSDKMSFNEFCENHFYASDTCYHPTLHKNQYDWLCDRKGQLLMDYIYKLEEFDKAIDIIKERTNGKLVLKNIRKKHNPNSKANDYRNLYNDRTRKIIEQRFEKDIDYFKYTF